MFIDHYETSVGERDRKIHEIGGYFPLSGRSEIIKRVRRIVNDWEGLDGQALEVLIYSARIGRFDEFATTLDKEYWENVAHIKPEARKIPAVNGTSRAEGFLRNLYRVLRIPRDSYNGGKKRKTGDNHSQLP